MNLRGSQPSLPDQTTRLLLRPNEAARTLGISPRTLWALPIPRVRIGKRGVRYDVQDIRLWIEEQKERS